APQKKEEKEGAPRRRDAQPLVQELTLLLIPLRAGAAPRGDVRDARDSRAARTGQRGRPALRGRVRHEDSFADIIPRYRLETPPARRNFASVTADGHAHHLDGR